MRYVKDPVIITVNNSTFAVEKRMLIDNLKDKTLREFTTPHDDEEKVLADVLNNANTYCALEFMFRYYADFIEYIDGEDAFKSINDYIAYGPNVIPKLSNSEIDLLDLLFEPITDMDDYLFRFGRYNTDRTFSVMFEDVNSQNYKFNSIVMQLFKDDLIEHRDVYVTVSPMLESLIDWDMITNKWGSSYHKISDESNSVLSKKAASKTSKTSKAIKTSKASKASKKSKYDSDEDFYEEDSSDDEKPKPVKKSSKKVIVEDDDDDSD